MNPKKLIILIGTSLAIVIVAVWIFKYLTTAVITVRTDGAGYFVRLVKISNGRSSELGDAKPIDKSLDWRVRPGEYEVVVYAKQVSASKNVSLKSRQHTTVFLNPVKPVAGEPVYGSGVSGFLASDSGFVFVRDYDGKLIGVGPNDSFTTISERGFDGARWSDPSFGVAEGRDKKFYGIKGGSVTPLALPFDAADRLYSDYTVSPDHVIYVSHGYDVYRGVGGENFTKIYSSRFNHLRLAASRDRLAVFYVGTEGSDEGVEATMTPEISILDAQGKVVANKKGVMISRAVWSGDGKKLLAEGAYGALLFSASLDRTINIPSINIGSIAWEDSDTFLYAAGNQLWRYRTRDGESYLLSSLTAGGTIDGIYMDSGRGYAYLSASRESLTKGAGSTGQLVRIGLRGQPVSKSLRALNIFLPESVGVCELNYANFTSPVITVEYPSSTTAADFCTNAAKGELLNYGLSPGQFQLRAAAVGKSE